MSFCISDACSAGDVITFAGYIKDSDHFDEWAMTMEGYSPEMPGVLAATYLREALHRDPGFFPFKACPDGTVPFLT